MRTKGFEGWYFKHQNGSNIIAFIPGRADSGSFVQMISTSGSRHFDVPELSVEHGLICAGNCRFSQHGCKIDLPGVSGEIAYGGFETLGSDIMGPFRFFPMECRHCVISMAHTLSGSLTVDDKEYSFSEGLGYIEKDSGTSFPSSYLWLQCNDFSEPCSVMVSIAHIPFCGMSFKGCICAIVYENREYRLATYKGVCIHAADANHICLSQGKLLLEIDIKPAPLGHPLRSPVRGIMSGTICENSNATVRVRLWEHGKPVFDMFSKGASYEFVPPITQKCPES